jgi:DNA-binding NtrC family response regulator
VIKDNQPKKPNILVTDDDECVLELIGNIIRSWGYEVVTLRRKDEALARLGEIKPDVVTTDLVSPGLGGFEFIRLVKEHDPSIPVIVLSGNIKAQHATSGEDARTALQLGAFECLPKPCPVSVIQAAIERALKTRGSQAES